MGHALMENRHGLAGSWRVSKATGTAERDEARALSPILAIADDDGEKLRWAPTKPMTSKPSCKR